MEDDDWEEHAAKNDSSTRQIDRMIEAEVPDEEDIALLQGYKLRCFRNTPDVPGDQRRKVRVCVAEVLAFTYLQTTSLRQT